MAYGMVSSKQGATYHVSSFVDGRKAQRDESACSGLQSVHMNASWLTWLFSSATLDSLLDLVGGKNEEYQVFSILCTAS